MSIALYWQSASVACPSSLSNCSPAAFPVLAWVSLSRRQYSTTGINTSTSSTAGLALSLIPGHCSSTRRRMPSTRCFSALTPELKTTLDKVVASNKVVVFIKGTKDFPQCGFSNTVVQILTSLNVPFETINILENEILRQGLKEYSSWPTFPQVFIDGDFFGGCDITVEAYKSGELQEVVEKAMCS